MVVSSAETGLASPSDGTLDSSILETLESSRAESEYEEYQLEEATGLGSASPSHRELRIFILSGLLWELKR